MKSKTIFISVFFVLAIIGFIADVSAATTVNIVSPTSNFSNFTGSVRYLNASILAGVNITNVTFSYQPWLYQNNGSWIVITTIQNTSIDQTTFNTTWDTTTVAEGKNYTLNVSALVFANTVNSTNFTGNITIDNTAPLTAATGYTNATAKKNTEQLTINISVSDATVGLLNSSNSFCFVNVSGTSNQTIPLSGGWCNSSTLSLTGLADGNRTIQIYVNDTLNNMRLNSTLVVKIDTTGPTASPTCSPSTVQTGDTFPCSCSGTDATSGVDTSTGSSTSGSITSTSNTGVFTYTCSVTDLAGNTVSATSTYIVTQTPGGSTTTTPTPSIPSRVYSFAKITPGSAVIMKDFNAETGLKQIDIEVANEAQNVKISVTKYDGKPAEVSVSKSGKVYQYLQIDAQNLADKLERAKVQFKVEKSWASSNGLDKDEIAISKFDETSSKWNELSTNYASEDNNYYYYDVELDSFSFFAIAERSSAGSDTGATGTTPEESRSLLWLWILIAVVVLAAIGWSVGKRRK